MTELDPAVAAGRLGGFRPRAKERQRAIVFQDRIAGPLQVASVDHYVAGQEEAGAALGPGLIQGAVRVGWAAVRVG